MLHTTKIERKFSLAARLTDELEDHIWTVFSRYCKATGTLFNSPSLFQIGQFEINFEGQDGCRGCYDPMSLRIPIKFFTDTEESFNALESEKSESAAKKKKKEEQEKLAYELEELERLSKKHPNHNTQETKNA